MAIERELYPHIKHYLQPNKVVLIHGPRRVGKTFLLTKIIKELKGKENIKYVNGESTFEQDSLSVQDIQKLKDYLGNTTLLVVDEAHKIPHIGVNLKLIVDSIPNIKVIASGSASFVLAKQVGEPLTGRKWSMMLYPISASEIIDSHGLDFQKTTLDQNLIYGTYPEIFKFTRLSDKEKYLAELVESYLLRDILEFEGIQKSRKIRDLLGLLAFQIGKEVSLTELGNSLSIHKNTVARYLDLLEQSFVIVNIRGFSRNLRKEITKNSRYYFVDNGVRNTIINNLNPTKLRDDIGALWENYIAMERLKKQNNRQISSNNYFWRTWDKKEIDWVEMREGKLFGYEIKWGPKLKSKGKAEWLETYKDEAEFQIVSQDNYLDFII